MRCEAGMWRRDAHLGRHRVLRRGHRGGWEMQEDNDVGMAGSYLRGLPVRLTTISNTLMSNMLLLSSTQEVELIRRVSQRTMIRSVVVCQTYDLNLHLRDSQLTLRNTLFRLTITYRNSGIAVSQCFIGEADVYLVRPESAWGRSLLVLETMRCLPERILIVLSMMDTNSLLFCLLSSLESHLRL
jgi:hypothetical protein